MADLIWIFVVGIAVTWGFVFGGHCRERRLMQEAAVRKMVDVHVTHCVLPLARLGPDVERVLRDASRRLEG